MIIKPWNKINKYRNIYWILFIFFIPVLLFTHEIFKSDIVTGIVFLLYSIGVGIFLKLTLFKQTCPNCHQLFFPAWGDLFFTKCNNCGAKTGSELKK